MKKIVISAISGCLFSFGLFAQTTDLTDVLTEITGNNKELKAYQSYLDSRDAANETLNNLDDLELSGAYLPLGNNSTGHFMEFEVSQSFEFPSVYRTRNDFMEQDRKRRQIAYQKDRQGVVSRASALCTNLVYQQKKKVSEQSRIEQARKVYEQIEEAYRLEEVGKLELNKARIAWLQQQFDIERIDAEIERISTQLMGLNGGLEITFERFDYSTSLVLTNLDSLWKEKMANDPFFRYRDESEKTALANIAVQKKERLPRFDIGLNYEGVKGENYAGFSGGLSIPIWNRRNTVKAAEALHIYEKQQTDAVTTALFAEYEEWYEQFTYLLDRYKVYEASLNELDSDELLTKAYELGQLSYLEYYMELKFYQDAYDEMLAMEQELQLLRNKLLIHNL